MTPGRALVGALLVAAVLLGPAAPAPGQGTQVHGESSSFVGHGVAIVWAILRGTSEEDTQVVVRVAPAGGDHGAVSLEGVDPFSQRRQELLGRRLLGGEGVDLSTPRRTFEDLPRREIHLYGARSGPGDGPDLTVYFLGLPDTTPEFASEAALRAYVEAELAKLLRR